MRKIFKFLFVLMFLLLTVSGCVKKPEKTVIKFSSWGSETEISIIKPILKEFEAKNPDIKVEFIHIPKNYFQKLQLLVASNLTPDVMFINNIDGSLFIQNNIFLDLNQYLKSDMRVRKNVIFPASYEIQYQGSSAGSSPPQLPFTFPRSGLKNSIFPENQNFSAPSNLISKKDFFPKALEAFKYKNGLYALPRDISNLVIYYNKDLFDKFHVSYPDNNWDFKEFLTTAKKLTKDLNNDKKIDIFGTGFEDLPLFWVPFLWSNGGGIISPDLTTVLIDKPESLEAIQFYADLRNKYHVAPTASEAGSAKMTQFFIQGKLAMQINGRWSVPRLRKDANFRWDIAEFPKGKAGSIVDADASGWTISRTSVHKAEAWRLIKFLASKHVCLNFTKSGLIVPARIDAANSDVFLSKNLLPEHSELFIKIISKSMPTPAPENYPEIMDTVNTALEPVWNGNLRAKQAVNEDVVRKIRDLLK
ncbi:MAG: sugar ABC transporter substrate-binding protein [Candidatus Gastranaerophilales bacterium]|nr:sugar ABC transporter substrate-binding protein [Candidatus Gastranaerophilales bacterium]